mmetsp:Transcript_85323/g.276279  ORF Transcript_85323/g.276279 Transcript_85323/m.276279 type:complete len:315 (-) Transcript_85323:216-1160(-)
MLPISWMGRSSRHSSRWRMAPAKASASATSLLVFRALGALGKLISAGLPFVSGSSSLALEPVAEEALERAEAVLDVSSPLAEAASGPRCPGGCAVAVACCCDTLSCCTTLSNSSWSRVSMRSWPSFAAQRTQPDLPASGPSSAVTKAQGQRPSIGHSTLWMSVAETMQPAESLPTSLLSSASASRSARRSRMRYLPPASQGQGPSWLPPAPTDRMLDRGGDEPPTRLFRWMSTTCGPSKFTGYSRRSPPEVSGLSQPMRPASVRTSALSRTWPPSSAAPRPSSSTSTSSPGMTSPTQSLARLASARSVAGFLTM